jgi:hypothetical protein
VANNRQVYAAVLKFLLMMGTLAVVWRALSRRPSPGVRLRLRVHQDMLPWLDGAHTRQVRVIGPPAHTHPFRVMPDRRASTQDVAMQTATPATVRRSCLDCEPAGLARLLLRCH